MSNFMFKDHFHQSRLKREAGLPENCRNLSWLQAQCDSRLQHSCQNGKHKTWQASHEHNVQDKEIIILLCPPLTHHIWGTKYKGASNCNPQRMVKEMGHFSQKRSHNSFLFTNISRADIWPRGDLILLDSKGQNSGQMCESYKGGRLWWQRSTSKSALAQASPVCECGYLRKTHGSLLLITLLPRRKCCSRVGFEDIPLVTK